MNQHVILPEFQAYLLSSGIVAKDKTHFYAWWAGCFPACSNGQELLPLKLGRG